MKTAVLFLIGVVAAASYLPLIRKEDWWIRIFDFPRLQIFALGLLALAVFLSLWDLRGWSARIVLAVLAPALLLQAYNIYRYTSIGPKEVQAAQGANPDATLALFVANVLMTNRATDRLLGLVEEFQPDIVLLLEPDDWWEKQMRVLEDRYPFTSKEPRDNRYGMLLYSRLPLIEPEIKHLVRDGVPSMHVRVRLRTGDVMWLHCVHPEPPAPTEAESSVPRDAELLIVGREVKGRDVPTIVTGDLNDVAWSHTTRLFQKISGLLDPRKGRGMFNTFHARIPFMRWPLYHVFHSKHFLADSLQRLPAFGSDHFPFFVRLVLATEAGKLQGEPVPDAQDREQADEKIEKARPRESL